MHNQFMLYFSFLVASFSHDYRISLVFVQLKKKISQATSAIKSVFGQEENKEDAVSSFLFDAK